jgi:biopolymer transport protein TolR
MASAELQSGNASSDGLTDINITPLVDIFLVLLVIVLVSSQLVEHKAIPIQVPGSIATSEIVPKVKELAMDAKGQLWLDGNIIQRRNLRNQFAALLTSSSDPSILISVDESQPYREVIALLDSAKSAGIKRASLKLESR